MARDHHVDVPVAIDVGGVLGGDASVVTCIRAHGKDGC